MMRMGRINLVRSTGIARRMLGLALMLFWAGTSPATAQDMDLQNFELEDLFGNNKLRHPVDIVWTPDGRVLVPTKEGVIHMFDENFQDESIVLDLSDLVCIDQERGLLSILLHPNFEENNYIYVYYIRKGDDGNCLTDNGYVPDENGPAAQLSRFIFPPNSETIDMSSEKEIIVMGPSGKMHNGGGMAFGTDGYIYLATGDTGHDSKHNVSPVLNNLFGKILRVTDEGDIPMSNPYYAANNDPCTRKNTFASNRNKKCPQIFSVGFRNPFNLAMDPIKESVRFFVGDVGRADWEEVNEGGVGFETANYGWRGREGPCEEGKSSADQCGLPDSSLTDPIHWYPNPEDGGSAQTGGAFVPPGIWPTEWDGAFLYSDLRASTLYHMKHTPEEFCRGTKCRQQTSEYTAVPMVANFKGSLLRLRFGPYLHTKALYLITFDGGRIYRLSFSGDVNRKPKPVIEQFLSSNGSGLTVNFDASKSSDPDGDDMTFVWDFGEEGSIASSNITASHTYSTVGKFTVTLAVTDMKGYKAKSSLEINVEEYPKPLVAFPWSSGEACDGHDQNYDYCGSLEFCTNGDIHGYRLPGEQECAPRLSPVIRVTPGKKYKFTLTNMAAEGNPTNVHTHGLHISGSGDADDVTRIVHAGSCLDYTWDILADHPPGTHWYHPHLHYFSEKQVTGGAVGLLIVDDIAEDALPEWTSNELLLQILRVNEKVYGNGKHYEVFDIDANRWYRLRLSTVDPLAVPLELRFTSGCKVHKVASDGIWHSLIPDEEGSTYQMTGASRGDFAIRCESPNSFVNILYGDEVAAIFNIGQEALIPDNADLEVWTPVRPPSLQDISSAIVTSENQYIVNVQRATINDMHWDAKTALTTIAFDEVHEWAISDTTEHPFHMHLYHMQVVTSGGCGSHKEGEFYDTISGPPCTVRFKTADIGERVVIHCHVMMHSDVGAMGWVDVQPLRDGLIMPINNVTSLEYTCGMSDVESPAETLSPIATPASSQNPTPSPTQKPVSIVSEVRKNTFLLLADGDILSTDGIASSTPEGYFLHQRDNGELELHQGSPGTSEAILWTSTIPSTENGEFFTTLRGDGHLLTRKGTPAKKGDFVWKSKVWGPIGDYRYFLEYNSDEQKLEVRQFSPNDPGSNQILWHATANMNILNPETPSTFFLLEGGDVIHFGDTRVSNPEGYYLHMRENGILELHKGSPGSSEGVLWESDGGGIDDSGFFTSLQKNGRLTIREGTPSERFGVVWRSDEVGTPGDYHLEYNPSGNKLSIIGSSDILWNVELSDSRKRLLEKNEVKLKAQSRYLRK